MSQQQRHKSKNFLQLFVNVFGVQKDHSSAAWAQRLETRRKITLKLNESICAESDLFQPLFEMNLALRTVLHKKLWQVAFQAPFPARWAQTLWPYMWLVRDSQQDRELLFSENSSSTGSVCFHQGCSRVLRVQVSKDLSKSESLERVQVESMLIWNESSLSP